MSSDKTPSTKSIKKGKPTLPAWIQAALPITPDDVERITPLLRSWVVLNTSFADMTEMDILKAALIEAMGKRREIVYRRCMSRVRTLRGIREYRELEQYVEELLHA